MAHVKFRLCVDALKGEHLPLHAPGLCLKGGDSVVLLLSKVAPSSHDE